MSLVSPSQSNSGDTIEATDINNPINQLAAVINGNLDSTNLADNAVTSAKLAAGAVTTVKVNRNNNSTLIVETAAKIQSGWIAISCGGSNTATAVINFPVTFTNVPIVTASYGGDSSSNSALGSEAVNLKRVSEQYSYSETTTSFTYRCYTSDGANWPAGAYAFVKWIAIGA